MRTGIKSIPRRIVEGKNFVKDLEILINFYIRMTLAETPIKNINFHVLECIPLFIESFKENILFSKKKIK